jgi:hypothetical protein
MKKIFLLVVTLCVIVSKMNGQTILSGDYTINGNIQLGQSATSIGAYGKNYFLEHLLKMDRMQYT